MGNHKDKVRRHDSGRRTDGPELNRLEWSGNVMAHAWGVTHSLALSLLMYDYVRVILILYKPPGEDNNSSLCVLAPKT
jgi:hypothetical protein